MNYRLSTGEAKEEEEEEGGGKKSPRMQHIEKQSQPLLCSLELNRQLSRQVRGRNLKSYFPLAVTH